jgi:hypothetical protein
MSHNSPLSLWQQAAERAESLDRQIFQTNLAHLQGRSPPPSHDQVQEAEDARKLAQHLFEEAKLDLGMTLTA